MNNYRVDSLKLENFNEQMNLEAFLQQMHKTGWKLKFIFSVEAGCIHVISERKKWWEIF